VDPKTRRRGAELEAAILDAAWEQLLESGYPEFTFESVAARAGTSRTVLYRRWTDRAELLQAAAKHSGLMAPIDLPDTGSLRDDVLGALRRINAARSGFTAIVGAQLAGYFSETGTSMADLRESMRSSPRSGLQRLVDRAVERGELDPAGLTPRIVELPMSLMRSELLMTLKPVPERVMLEIVDDVWMPLLRARGAMR
jgi:AcrR family transcriptional regulator